MGRASRKGEGGSKRFLLALGLYYGPFIFTFLVAGTAAVLSAVLGTRDYENALGSLAVMGAGWTFAGWSLYARMYGAVLAPRLMIVVAGIGVGLFVAGVCLFVRLVLWG